jgi:hypothetical protein
MARIPFKLPDVGLNEIKGLVYVDGDRLVIRYGSSLVGLFETESDEVVIEWGELEDLRIEKGLFKDRLVISPLGVELLDRIPGQHPSSLKLRVWKKYRKDLLQLVATFQGTS